MLKDNLLKLNLQFFADEDTTDGEVETTENTNNEQEQDNTTFTQSDVDREVSKAVEAFKKNQEPKQQEAINQAVKEALAEQQRLSKLSEKERQEEELTQREKELNERLAEIERKELKADAVADLNKKGLPDSFADFLLADNAENTLKNINVFKEAFDGAVNEAVKEKLRQDTPPAGNAGNLKGDNLGKKLAKLNKQNSVDFEKAQGNYFSNGGN